MYVYKYCNVRTYFDCMVIKGNYCLHNILHKENSRNTNLIITIISGK